jgi:hypothetical protein
MYTMHKARSMMSQLVKEAATGKEVMSPAKNYLLPGWFPFSLSQIAVRHPD